MNRFSRRSWLKSAGLAAGSTSLWLHGWDKLASVTLPWETETALSSTNPGIIKLSSNENPYGPSELVRKAMQSSFDLMCRYPAAEIQNLTEKLAEKEQVSPEHILITVGSTEGLKIAVLAYLRNGGEIVVPHPTFEAMPNYAEACGAYVHKVPLDKNMVIDLEAMRRRCNADTRMVFVCNPNNPTGTILDAAAMEQFCADLSVRTMVFADEVYIDYITEKNYPSMTSLVRQGYNVIVARSFSKVYGLAGLRIGYLVARPDIISRLKKMQIDRPNMMALVAAEAALAEKEFYQFSLAKNSASKKVITDTLDTLDRKYIAGHANFVYFDTGMPVTVFQDKMKSEGIMVGRVFDPYPQWCRLSTGRTEDMPALKNALLKVLS
jgi:histidinol-phosphate aminotransferase